MAEEEQTSAGPLGFTAVVLMGVTGSGKTTIGTLLAKRLGAIFADADDYHSAANKEKMHAGIPLTDEDRAPWLATLHSLLSDWVEKKQEGVLACSALKEGYRDTLSAGTAPGTIAFVWLDGSRELFAARLATRQHEFMSPALLDSQIATLEPPKDAIRVVNGCPPDEVVDEVLAKLGMTASH